MRLLKVEWDPRLFPFFPFLFPSLFHLLSSLHDLFLPLYITGVV